MKTDLQDVLSIIGIAAIIAGLWMWSTAAAIIAFGAICLTIARRIEREKASRKERAERTF